MLDDYVETPISNVPKNGTFEAWIRTTSQDREAVISSYSGDQEFRVHLNYQPGKSGSSPGILGLNVRFRTLTAYVGIGEEMCDGSWHHIGLVRDGTNRALYVDDVEVIADTQGDLGSTYGGLNIGASKNLDPGSFFSGLIDDVKIYNRAVKP